MMQFPVNEKVYKRRPTRQFFFLSEFLPKIQNFIDPKRIVQLSLATALCPSTIVYRFLIRILLISLEIGGSWKPQH